MENDHQINEEQARVRIIKRTKNANDIKFIISILKSHFVFSNFEEHEQYCYFLSNQKKENDRI